MMRRSLVTLAAAAILPLAAWVGGYDFDSRGFWQAYLFLCTALVAVFTWFSAGIDE